MVIERSPAESTSFFSSGCQTMQKVVRVGRIVSGVRYFVSIWCHSHIHP